MLFQTDLSVQECKRLLVDRSLSREAVSDLDQEGLLTTVSSDKVRISYRLPNTKNPFRCSFYGRLSEREGKTCLKGNFLLPPLWPSSTLPFWACWDFSSWSTPFCC